MQFLNQNIDNSAILPYDIMITIYEYADVLAPIRRQIENKEYNLDEIMYNRMVKYLKNRLTNPYKTYQLIDPVSYNQIIISHTNIDDINLKDKILNWNDGYKNVFLWKSKNTPMLCGIESHYSLEYFRYKMQEQLKYTNTEISDSQLYNSWIHI